MRTLPIHVDATKTTTIYLGKQGESLACRVRFYASKWHEDYPEAEYQLFVSPPGATPYLANITEDNGVVTWELAAEDTTIPGTGSVELILTDGKTKIKSVTYSTTLDKSPSSQEPGDAPQVHPTWWENAIAKINEATEEAVSSIDSALESEKAEAKAAIAKAAEDAIASIPEDYTALAGEVSSLKDHNALLGASVVLRNDAPSGVTAGERWGFCCDDPTYIEAFTPEYMDIEGDDITQYDVTWYIVQSNNAFANNTSLTVLDTGTAKVGDTIKVGRIIDRTVGFVLYSSKVRFKYCGNINNNQYRVDFPNQLFRTNSHANSINAVVAGAAISGEFEILVPHGQAKLRGHTWSLMGDSITDDSTSLGVFDQYFNFISARVGRVQTYNYGASGERITQMAARYNALNYSDIITVFGGVNDWGLTPPTPLGTIEDTTLDTFYGALNVLCAGLQTMFPRSLIMFITPLGDNGFFESNDENSLGLTVYDYADAIKDVCAKYKIPVCDACRESGLNPQIAEIKDLYFIDGLHPNAAGHERLSYLIQSELERHYIGRI